MPVPVNLKIASDTSLYWNGTIIDRRQFLMRLDAIAVLSQPPALMITPAGSIRYEQLADILVELDKRSLHSSFLRPPANGIAE